MKIDFQLKELSPNSRFSIHEAPPLFPGCCFICSTGSGDGRKFLYFGKSLPLQGAIYFCSECVREIAEAIGYYPSEVLQMLLEGNKEFQSANQSLKKVLESKDETIRTMARTISDCNCSIGGSNPSDDEIDEACSESESDDPKPLKLDGLERFGSIRSAGEDE
jgi:hypothetical protein